ncbi:hypothetical protein D6D05_10250 [Aureobasidium pullulans]|nr:hypothetical protein D6D05_10250 [Aureobasidium pullulans]
MLPSISYRAQPLSPAFGSPTARAKCVLSHRIYALSFYDLVAMLTVSSLVFYAARDLRRLPKDASSTTKSLYYGLGLVGVCLSLFHGLLSYYA